MNPPNFYEVVLFDAVRQIEDPTEQQGFLAWTLRDNPEMLERLVAMLAAENEFSHWFDNASAARLKLEADILTSDPTFLETSIEENQGGLHMPTGIPGRFHVLRQIGGGGGGEVFLADQLAPIQRKVAVKVLRAGMETPDFLAAFRRESQSLAMMNHPNIAVIHDAGTTAGGRPYFIMEMVDGEKITDFCEDSCYTIHQRLELFLQVCEAIQHAHQKGVIHRDIKPGNILVTTANGQPMAKVIDFGIASAVDEVDSNTLPLTAGTPAFMSPEQAAGAADIDTRTDIYALGIVLRELLSGPCGEGAAETIMSQAVAALAKSELAVIAAARKTTASRLPGLLRGDLDAIVAKASSPDRQSRYATAAGLARDIQSHLHHESVIARPPRRRYRLAKLIRRNRLAFVTGTLAFIFLAAGFSTSTWLFFRESEARREQSRLRDVAELARAAESRLRERAEARELCVQAAVRMYYGNIDEADRLVAGIRQGMVPSSLEANDVFTKLGDWHRIAGRWPQAAERFSSLVESHLSVDSSDTADISLDTLYALGAVCRASDWPRYEYIRKLTINRFAKSQSPQVAEQVIKLALLRPLDDATMRTLSPMEEILRKSIPAARLANPVESNRQAWNCVSLALWRYRSGDFAQAIIDARHSYVMEEPWNPARNAIANTLQALSMWQLGRTDEAHALFSQVSPSIPVLRECVDNLPTGDFFVAWWDSAIAVTIYDEAAILLRQN